MRKLVALGLQWKKLDKSGSSKQGQESMDSQGRLTLVKGADSAQGSKSERISWHESFHELLAFYRFHGHTNVQVSNLTSTINKKARFETDTLLSCPKDDLSLRAWMSQQRVAFRKFKLSQERFEKLNSIGFDLLSERDKRNTIYSDVDWNFNFEKLTDFHNKTGNTNVKMVSTA
jgi:hypothetical protein